MFRGHMKDTNYSMKPKQRHSTNVIGNVKVKIKSTEDVVEVLKKGESLKCLRCQDGCYTRFST